MNYLKLFEITVIVVIIVDISGFIDSIKTLIGKILHINNVSIKLIECSFCVNWWLSLLYLYITNNLTLSTILFALLCSTLTPIIKDSVFLIRDIFGKIILKINDLIQ